MASILPLLHSRYKNISMETADPIENSHPADPKSVADPIAKDACLSIS